MLYVILATHFQASTRPHPQPPTPAGSKQKYRAERGEDPTMKQTVPFLVVVKYLESVILVPYLWPDSARQKKR